MAKAKSVIDVILGEAVHGTRRQRYDDMVAIASVIANRARELGVTPEQVISAPGEFSAYNKALPAGVESLRELAHQALSSVEINGPVHNATFYATPNATKNLPKGLTQVGATTGHVYFDDPKNRAIQTAVGYKTPQVSLPTPPSAPAATSIAPSINAGPAGYAYGDLVAPTRVSTRSVSSDFPAAPPSPSPAVSAPSGGFADLAPNGLIGDNSIASYDRSNLDPSIAGVLGNLGSDPRFAGIGVRSGYRDPKRNAKAGGATRSMHMQAKAVDLDVAGMDDETKAALVDRALSSGVKGLGVYASGNSIHLDTRASPAVWGPAGFTGINNYDGKPGFSDEDISTLPGWAQPMARSLVSGNVYNPHFGAPVPTARPELPDFARPAYGDVAPPNFSAPLGEVDRAPLPDLPTASPAATAAFNAAAAGFAAPDVASNFPARPATIAPNVSPQSLPDIGGMPLGTSIQNVPAYDAPINASTQFAPPVSDFPARPAMIAPNVAPNTLGTAPNLLSPTPMSPTLSPPTEVADYNVADVISPIPDAPASPTVSPTVEGAFPAAPEAPSTWDKVKYTGKPIARDAMLGLKLGGPLGALGVTGVGMLGRKLGLGLRPGFDNAAPDRFSTGFGLPGITSAMGGPKGSQGFSLSNPGMSFTSLGNGMGLRRSDRFGWTEVVGPGGEVRGIKYDNPKDKGLLGKLSKSMNDKFGGGISDAERASFSGRVGLY